MQVFLNDFILLFVKRLVGICLFLVFSVANVVLKGRKMSSFFQQIWQIIIDSNLLNVTGAVIVLLVGYLAALVIGRKCTDLIQRIAGKTVILPDGTEVVPITRTARIFGRAVYAIIMLLAVLGCFSVLKLYAAAEPLREFISGITAFLPNIAGALLLVFFAWVIAELVKIFCAAFLRSVNLAERFPADCKDKCNPEKFISYTAITRPLQSMFEKFLTFIPNLAAAVLILLVGLWAADLARKAVKGLIVLSGANKLAENLDLSATLRNGSLAAMAGWTVYVLIALPVVAAALTALDIDILSRAIAGFFRDILSVSGLVAASAAILLATFIGGKFIASTVERFASAWGFDGFFSAFCNEENKVNTVKPSAIAGKLARLALWVLAITAVCDIMEFEKLASLVKRFAIFGGNIILSSIVLLIGIKLANIAAAMVRNKCSVQIEYCIKAAVVIFTIALAISNLKLGSSIVEIAFALLLGAFAVAAAIAFGIGGKETAAKILEQWLEKIKK